jgi:beta-xylosidase
VGPTYTNPVWPGYFADPFVLRHDGAYYAYGTGSVVGGRVFEVLTSPDLVSWRSLGGALEPVPDPALTDYWAPEVAEHDGTFFLYYSAGTDDVGHTLRVAAAAHPAGPFTDLGTVLTPGERFAIDPHPFTDAEGGRWLFFARDDLEGERPGTVLAVDRLVDMTRLAGEARTILRATGDWQRYLRDRPMYGAVYDWHTLEGPTVLHRHGRYWLLYSGGAWHADGYGVSWAVADSPAGPWTEPHGATPTVLRTVPGQVLGPGHNSVIQGPGGGDVIVYHAWDAGQTARRMCIDPLMWGPDGPLPVVPTVTTQTLG